MVLLGLLLSRPAVGAGEAAVKFDLRADEVMNLAYQLDCLPKGRACAFEGLWKNELGWSADDDVALARRQEIKHRYQWNVVIDDELDDGPLMFDAPRGLELGKKLTVAAGGAADLAAYRARLELVVTATDAAELTAITERFLPRFRRFFADARPRLLAVAGRLGPFFSHPGVRRVVGQTMSFYGVSPATQRGLAVHLIALPRGYNGPSHGEQVEHLSVVEVRLEAPAGRAADKDLTGPITLHELCHYFYASAPGERARALASAFASSDDLAGPAAYGLLNEALATALGQLTYRAFLGAAAWQEEEARGGHWYLDQPIDTAARAIFSWLEARVTEGRGLYQPDFVPGYVRLLRAAFGAGLDRPALKLRTLVALVEDAQIQGRLPGESPGRVQVARPLTEPGARELLARHGAQSAVIKLRGASLAQLRPWEPMLGRGLVDRLTRQRRAHRAFIQAVKHGSRAFVYILVADTPDELERLSARLVAADKPFDLLTL
jgi:hypothetical protein